METARLILRRCSAEDLDPLAAVFAEPAVWRYPYGRGWSREETERFLADQEDSWDEQGVGLWAVELKSSGALIGMAGLSVPAFLPEVLPAIELGWRLHPDSWGQGLATESGHAGLDYGFRALAADRILSIAQPENAASVRVAQKLGMRRERTAVHPSRGVELAIHALERSEWTAQMRQAQT